MSFISIIFCNNRRGDIIAITWSVLRDVRRRRKQHRFTGIQECPNFLKSIFPTQEISMTFPPKVLPIN